MLGETRIFDYTVKSHEIGIAKPDARIYSYADSALPPGAGRAVLIDDGEVNCSAAERHGWGAIHHTDTDMTIEILRTFVPPQGGKSR